MHLLHYLLDFCLEVSGFLLFWVHSQIITEYVSLYLSHYIAADNILLVQFSL